MLNPIQILSQSELISAIVRHPLVVTPDTTVMEAIAHMSGIRVICASARDTRQLDELHIQARSSCVAIVEDGRLLGILTERDIVRLSSQQRDLANLAIRDVMTSNVVTLRASDFTDIFVAVNLLQQHHIRHLPVVDDLNCLVGLVTHESLQRTSRPVDLLRLRIVAEVMTTEVVCAAPELSMLEIARLMTVHRVSSVMIVQPQLDQQQKTMQMPIGIVTERDIVQFQALSLNLETYQVQAVMSTPIFAVKSSDSLWLVQQILEQRFIQRLAVTGDQGELLGIVTQTSLLQALNPLELYNLAEALEAKVLKLEADKVQLLEHHTINLEHQIEERTKKLQSLNIELELRVAQRTAELQESQQFLQTVIETFPLAVFWKDRASRYLGCNYNFAQDANLSLPEQIVGMTDKDLPWSAVAGTAYSTEDQYVIESGLAILGTIEIQTRADGISRWVETNKIPLRNIDGETIGVLGTYQDITERKRTEIKLNRLSERLSLSLKSGAVGCWEWDIMRDCLIWDDRMYELYGQKKSSDREAYSFWLDTLHPDDRAATAALVEKSLSGQTDFDTEFRVIHPDGSIHFIKAYGLLEKVRQDCSHSMIGINFDITAAKHDELLRQQNEQLIRQQAERESVLREITQRIRRSLDLKTIFETSVHEIRQFMETDRVGVFKFNADSNLDAGEFVAESVGTEFKAILGVKIHDPGFGKRLGWSYQQDTINVIQDIQKAGLLDREIKFLAKFQVQANLVIPLLNGSNLWGLLCVDDCTAPRFWQESEVNFVTQIAEQISIGIQQATLYEKVQLELEIRWRAEEAIALQLRQQQTLGLIALQIRNSLKVEDILATATVQVKELMMVDRVTIFRVFPDGKSRVIEEVVSPEYPALLDMNWEDEQFSKEGFDFYMQGKPRIVVDVMQDEWSKCLNECMRLAQVESKIVAPILLPFGAEETHRWVNTKGDIQLWGLLIVHACGVQRHWQDTESQLLQQVADQLAIAIQQASLFEQLRQELAERQQAESAIALQLRQQKTLGSIALQIRNSLKVEDILATATAQVKELMMVDRAAIFRVSADRHLRAVEEVVSLEYPSVMIRNWENAQLSQAEFEFYLAGNSNIVVDLQQDPWSVCLQEYIKEINVKSKIVVPILLVSGNSGTNLDFDTWDEPYLWGLLSVHSCSSQRRWRDSEAKLLQQIADQLAIAIHQANLFEKLQQELTERGQTEARLIESNQELARATRLKDEFLASMSHELRTPLNAILGMSESLQEAVFGAINERQQKSIGTIEKSGKHLLALINDILDLSKMEANKFNLELIDVSIQSICQNSTLFVKELAMKRQIRLKTQLPEQLKYLNIRVDDLRFRQVLINLLSNAVKFTPEGGSIILDVQIVDGREDSQQQIIFSIVDTGIGIAPENMDKLFQSFVQIDSSLSRQYAGTGLGLSLVKRIVEMHGGTVSVQSEVNQGSCFTVSLPFCPSEEIAVVSSSAFVYPINIATDAEETLVVKTQTSILLVEDDEGNVETMTTYLESRGYQIVVAENGQQAISILEDCANGLVQSCLPDIILMDIQMPGMDGFEATTRIRQIPDYANIPIIALTALAMPTDRQRCLDAGANQYMSKPVKLSQLVASIETLLNSR
jgi:PAS domain S-box-containing protein